MNALPFVLLATSRALRKLWTFNHHLLVVVYPTTNGSAERKDETNREEEGTKGEQNK